MVERVRPSVVQIGAELGEGLWGFGSGVIFEVDASAKTAFILTNHHVIGGGRRIQVLINDMTIYPAVVVGADVQKDLAVFRICCSISFRALPFGDASNLSLGTEVVAIGYPLPDVIGELAPGSSSPTVTRGIVSAKRDVSTFIEDEYFEAHVIQTDAPINPGNSGGPLFTPSGEIIGLNTFGITSAEGLGFAVSEITISAVLPNLLAGSQITTPETPLGILPVPFNNGTHWYTLQVPSGWTIDYSDPSGVVLWHPDSPLDSLIFVQISFEEIDPLLYPTLKIFRLTNQPHPPADCGELQMLPLVCERFQITAQQDVRTDQPVRAHRFEYRYGPDDSLTRVVEDWYLLGRFLARVSAAAASDIWLDDQYLAIRQQLELILDTFQPSVFTSGDGLYSMAHPLTWQILPGDIADYWAEDPDEEQRVFVQIQSAEGHTSASTYAEQLGHLIGETLRQVVFEGRPNPSFRIEYFHNNRDIHTEVRGAALITLAGPDAIWVFVEGKPNDGDETRVLADDILLRFAVRG